MNREPCECIDGCGWVSTAVGLVFGNPTAGDVPKATAAEIVRRVNSFDRLLAACEAARAFGSQGETHDGLSVSEMLRSAIEAATTTEGVT